MRTDETRSTGDENVLSHASEDRNNVNDPGAKFENQSLVFAKCEKYKKMRQIVFCLTLGALIAACSEESFRRTMQTVSEQMEGGNSDLTTSEVTRGLKEALVVGTNNAVSFAGKENGFLNTPRLRIPFPEEAEKVKSTAIKLGLSGQVDAFEENLNHAAEKAVSHAAPIFVDAITSMSIEDAFAILRGEDQAATNYLRQNTENELRDAFRPEVREAIEAVELTKYWSPLASAYNSASILTGADEVNPDLTGYVTDEAMDGLFLLIGEEERKIRENPTARVSDILKKVFGNADK
jgi:hypothetical protein